jgi:hypothetical protein
MAEDRRDSWAAGLGALADGRYRERRGAADNEMVERRVDRGAELLDGRELDDLQERRLAPDAWMRVRRDVAQVAADVVDAEALRELVLWAAQLVACRLRGPCREPRASRLRALVRRARERVASELERLHRGCLRWDARESLELRVLRRLFRERRVQLAQRRVDERRRQRARQQREIRLRALPRAACARL